MNTGIVLAAGMSTRMGEPKALVRWGDEPLLVYQVQQLLEAGCDEVIVVLGHQADLIHRELRRVKCRVMLNARFHAGRSGSVRIGAKAANRDTESILVIGVDQPRPAAFLKRLLDAHSPDFAATRPVHDGRHGHPVVLSGRLRPELMSVQDDDEGLRAVIRAHAGEVQDIETDDLALLDVNTPEDLARARARFGLATAEA